MNTRTKKRCLPATLAVLLSVFACSMGHQQISDLRTESRSVKLGDAKSVRVEIKMGAGELKVAGGAKELLEADFAQGLDAWQPQLEYSVSGGQGRLTLQQLSRGGGPMGGSRSVWDLHLNNNVPMDMKVELGAGRVQLTLGTLSLTNLEVEMGAGETVVDLTGDWKNDLSARIRGGVGRVKIRLPRDVGVRVEPEGRIGAVNARDLRRDGRVYVNDAYRKSDVTLRIDVKGGVGETHLELSDTSPVV